MDEIIEIVVPLAMLAISLATAIFSAKKNKEQKRHQQDFCPVHDETVEAKDDKVEHVIVEGVPAIPDKKASAVDTPVHDAAGRNREDKPVMSAEEKKKLIIYSEILKPKFDA